MIVAGLEFVKEVEATIMDTQKGNRYCSTELIQNLSFELNDLTRVIREPLTDEMRMRIMCLTTMHLHSREVIKAIINKPDISVSSFEWQAQLKPRY